MYHQYEALYVRIPEFSRVAIQSEELGQTSHLQCRMRMAKLMHNFCMQARLLLVLDFVSIDLQIHHRLDQAELSVTRFVSII